MYSGGNMKKLVKIILALTLVFLMTATAGCTFILDGKSKDNKNDTAIPEYKPGVSHELAEEVQLGSIPANEREIFTNFADVISAVERSCVAIKITDGTNIYYGSGTIVDVNDGEPNEYYIFTCHHVISSCGDITVYVPDADGLNYTDDGYDTQYEFTGKIGAEIYSGNEISLVGGDRTTDVAVLKLTLPQNSELDIEEAKVAKSDYVIKKGEEVFAIGNPTGVLPGTFTEGRVAYVNRKTNVSNVGEMTLIQLNLDIWHGNSGGALFNMYGELIGITNAGSDENSGINYAIPFTVYADANTEDTGFVSIAKQLIATKNANPNNYGYVSGHRCLFGVTFSNKNGNDTITVIEVAKNSLAEKAGLKVDDRVIKIDDATVTSYDDIHKFDTLKIGDKTKLTITRAGMPGSIDITLTSTQDRFCDTGDYASEKAD